MKYVSKSHSSYWLDDSIFFDDEEDILDDGITVNNNATDLARIIRLSAIRRSIGNFVSILANQNVPVEFSSGDNSYTTGDRVVIAADDNPKSFDVMVGLALHEGSHVLLSDFEFLKWINVHTKNPMSDLDFADQKRMFHPDVVEKFVDMPVKGDHEVYYGEEAYEQITEARQVFRSHVENIKILMNLLEDRHIDSYVYQRARGYRPYYDAMYEKYFFTTALGKSLKFDPEWRKLTVENYVNRLLLAFHPDADLDALPGLRYIVQLMDLKNISRVASDKNTRYHSGQYEDMPVLWQEANKIYAQILKFVDMVQAADEEGDNSRSGGGSGDTDGESQDNDSQDNGTGSVSDLPNLDGDMFSPDDMQETEVETTPRGKEGKYNEKSSKRQLDKIKDFMNGDVKKKRIKKAEAHAVNALEKADGQLVDISGGGLDFGEVMVTRKMNDDLITQDWFPFRSWNTWGLEDAISSGKRMGAILAHRLQVRNDPLVTTQTRLENGKIDRRLLAQLGMDLTGVFHKTRIDTFKPAMLHLTLDASSSMSGRKWNQVVTVATALATVGSKIRDIDVVITLRGGEDIPVVSVLFDSRKNKLPHFMKYIRKVGPSGTTPEGLCFKATMDLVLECKDTHDVYFINFSDGEPQFGLEKHHSFAGRKRSKSWDDYISYNGEFAHDHTRKQVQMIREHGVKVLSYFIGDDYGYCNKDGFNRMYGEDAVYVNVESATEVLRTLNKRLAER